jgi:hypothetical protein
MLTQAGLIISMQQVTSFHFSNSNETFSLFKRCLFTDHIIIYKHTHQAIVEEIVLVSLKEKNISFNYHKYYQ